MQKIPNRFLPVNGKTELVMQDAESYQRLLEAQDRIEAIEGIKRGLESMKRNAANLLKSFREFFAEHGLGYFRLVDVRVLFAPKLVGPKTSPLGQFKKLE